jgi:heme-degrading monooxygenase HmoA
VPPLPWKSTPEAGADGEVVIMASLLRLDRFWRIPGFLRAAMAIRQQVLGSDGALGVALDTDLPHRTFFTLSAWKDRDALNAFVRAEPHVTTMRRYRPAMSDSRFVFWTAEADGLPPGWPDVRDRLSEAAK